MAGSKFPTPGKNIPAYPLTCLSTLVCTSTVAFCFSSAFLRLKIFQPP